MSETLPSSQPLLISSFVVSLWLRVSVADFSFTFRLLRGAGRELYAVRVESQTVSPCRRNGKDSRKEGRP